MRSSFVLIFLSIFLLIFSSCSSQDEFEKDVFEEEIIKNLECFNGENWCYGDVNRSVHLDEKGDCIEEFYNLNFNGTDYMCSCRGDCKCPKGALCKCLNPGWRCYDEKSLEE